MKNFEPEESEDYLPLSGVLHFAFCKRRWALIHIEQQWEENVLTFSGRLIHRNADRIADVVEFHRTDTGISLPKYEGKWNVIPIEYKSGRKNSFGSDEMQLCCQALCLEEMFHTSIPSGYVYYGKNKRRVNVPFDEEIRERVRSLIQEMYSLFQRGKTPAAVYQKHCDNCSLMNLYLPHLSEKKQNVSAYLEMEVSRIYGNYENTM